jgi:hypothetical protein
VAGTSALMPNGEPPKDENKKEQKRIRREEKKAQKEYKTNKLPLIHFLQFLLLNPGLLI